MLHPVLLALLAAALFGVATPASKTLLGSLSPFQLAGLLYLGAVLGSLAVIIRRNSWRSPWMMSALNRWHLLGAVFFGGIAGPVLLLLGLRIASAASVSLWLNLELVATAVLGRLFFNDHLGKYGWYGVIGIVAASIILSFGQSASGIWAGLLVLGACICWGLDNHFTALIDGITPSQSTLWKGAIAGTVNLLIGIYFYPYEATAIITLGALLIGVLSYGASITLYIASAQNMGATRAQMFFASAPFFGAALSVIVLGEKISGLQIISAALFVISLAALIKDRHLHKHSHEAMSHEHSHSHDDGHHDHNHNDLDLSDRHSHWHEHEPQEHAHPHWPDLHHRHEHK